MSADPRSRLVVVGIIAGAHGVRGEVRVRSFTSDPYDCFGYGPLLDGEGQELLQPARVRPAKSHFIIVPEQPRTREDWEGLKGTRLHVPREALPQTDADEFYIEDLVGLSVHDGGEAVIGRVRAVQDFGAGELIEIEPVAGGKSVLVPFTVEDVPLVDLAAGRLVVADWATWSDAGE